MGANVADNDVREVALRSIMICTRRLCSGVSYPSGRSREGKRSMQPSASRGTPPRT
jgi:hypothetical protein